MFKDLKAILPKSIKRAGISKQIKETEILTFFQDELDRVLEPELLERVRVLYFKDKIITLAVLSEEIAQKIRFYEKEILGNINELLEKQEVEKVRYLT